MDVVYRCCAGIDVHKERVLVNLRRKGVEGKANLEEVRTYATMTRDLLDLCEWLQSEGCTHIAMESTGVYWKPIYNILGDSFQVILVNARHMKALPGRKSDVMDCQWIAQLLQHGLLKGSFIPSEPIRQLRDLTRQRRKLVDQRAAAINRIQKVLEDANIQLASVASDVTGKSGWAMLTRIVEGETDPTALADLALRRLKSKKPALQRALDGRITDHHRFLLRQHMRQIRFLEQMIGEYEKRIEEIVRPFEGAIPLLDTIPGINQTAAVAILAEIGPDMRQFPDHRHLCSWAGICPGNNESAGKHKSGVTRKGSKYLRAVLVECAWAASRTKDTYFRAQFRRIASRRGTKRALVALAHTMLTVVYHVLRDGMIYQELGVDFFDRLNHGRLRSYYVKRLKSLGYTVEIKESPTAA